MMVENVLEILAKRSQVFQQPTGVHSVAIVAGESISSVTLWNIYCESVR